MANRRRQEKTRRSSNTQPQKKRSLLRRSVVESLEPKRLLAGPQLIGIQPNSGELISEGSVQQVSPRELIFRFDENQLIDSETLDAIRITGSGGDGTFGLPVATSDFGSSFREPTGQIRGGVDIQLTGFDGGQNIVVSVTRDDTALPGSDPVFDATINGANSTLSIAIAPQTTAGELVDALNSDTGVQAVLRAELKGGHRDSQLMVDPSVSSLPNISVSDTGDQQIVPSVLAVDPVNQNEVVARFSGDLPDDNYRIEVFGFDDPGLGITALRGIDPTDPLDTSPVLIPRVEGSRSDRVDFSLDLGPQVSAVVPQPVVRLADDSLIQRRNEIVVYFNDDDLFVENFEDGTPTERSAENPRFYTLIFTEDSVSNRDDTEIAPTRVVYNPAADTATLVFDSDLSDLVGGKGGEGTFRLRVGTAEAIPIQPQRVELGAQVAATDLNSGGDGILRFQGTATAPAGVEIEFTNSNFGGVQVSVLGTKITVDLGGTPLIGNVENAINANPLAASLVTASVDGSRTAIVGTSATPITPLVLAEPGDTFTTAASVGEFGVSPDALNFRSVVLAGSIDPVDNFVELPGGNDDPGHRDGGDPDTFTQHVNPQFGADTTPGITTIPYNFRLDYGTNSNGETLVNAISDREKERVRESLDLWSRHLGVQFFETDELGVTFARGELSVLDTNQLNVERFDSLGFGVAIDPSIASNPAGTNAMLVLNDLREWSDRYGDDFFRTSSAAIGMLLGLSEAPDLPASTLLHLDNSFLAGTSNVEPVFPGNQDILHGQYVFRPESGDIDLYRFEVNLDDPNKLASVSAEAFAERLTESSLLDTTLTLYEETLASVTTDFGVFGNFEIEFTSVNRGQLGNRTGITLVDTPSGNPTPLVEVQDNQIFVYMTDPSTVQVDTLVSAINNSAAADLVTARLILSEDVDPTNLPTLAGLQEDAPSVLLAGGGIFPITRNDDYFSEDSYIEAELSSGVYYLGVAAAGNETSNPDISGTGFGGTTEGEYEVLLKFRPQVDETDVIRDLDGNDLSSNEEFRLPGSRLDGDSDGVAGGIHNFWFQTRPLERRISFINGGDSIVDGQVVEVTDFRGITRRLEFTTTGTVGANRIPVTYSSADSPETLATTFAAAMNAAGLQISATLDGTIITVTGEQTIDVPADITAFEMLGRTIFVDNFGGPSADGSLDRPFDSIAGLNVPNAFDATHSGDIVRIVGNGGLDQNPATLADNFAFEVGFSDLGATLQDGTEIEVPQGVTTMIDANAIFRSRRGYIGVGSNNLLDDRSNGALQVLGTPTLTDANGAVLRDATGSAIDGSVYFTSFRDQTIGTPEPGVPSTPAAGDWGGISFRRDVDRVEGRADLEDEGIFLQHVGHAEIRYGGGANVVIDGIQQLVNPITIVDMRPRIANNTIEMNGDAAISATPDSFTETNFQAPIFQVAGAFTSDYDRVGPDIYDNQLTDNGINGLFIRAVTPVGGELNNLTVAGRFDDTDIVHVLTENLIVQGTPGGPQVLTERPAIDIVTTEALAGGSLIVGQSYEYRMAFVDQFGNEGLPSDPTLATTITGTNQTLALTGLPPAEGDFLFRRVYRSRPDGRFDLVAVLDSSDPVFIDVGDTLSSVPITLDTTSTGRRAARPDASLKIDPGAVVKLQGARIEFQFGTQLLAEGLEGQEVVFTSLLDDRFGVGGEFDTNNDNGTLAPNPGDWGGLYFAPNSHVSLDHSIVSFAGGLTRIEGTFSAFGTVELHQATARITNSVFQDNADGQGGQGPADRLGRLDVTEATIFVRGSQPVIVGNTFERNAGSIIDIDGNSMISDLIVDIGRDTGAIDRLEGLDDNHGPLIRRNRLNDNDLNGLEIRGRDTIFVGGREFTSETDEFVVTSGNRVIQGTDSRLSVGEKLGFGEIAVPAVVLTTETIWDDTDIVHVPFQQFVTGNFNSDSGIRLQSRPDESLVVKFANGPGSSSDAYFGNGLTATGTHNDVIDRIGGSLHVIGLPGAPVVLTSLADDSIGASLFPDGTEHVDTNNDSFASRAEPNDWRGILLDEFSNDRNVEIILELEAHDAPAPGLNSNTINPQTLGELASSELDANDVFRMGFEIDGFLSAGGDIDVYQFTGIAGTEIWLDIDGTSLNTDTVIELLDAEGNLLVRSDNSTAEVTDPTLIENFALRDAQVGSLQQGAAELDNFNDFGLLDEFGTTNLRDAGVRVSLPGVRGSRTPYFVRVRSQSVDPNDALGGYTDGPYTLQIRTQDAQEFPGSTVRFADIRYANHGVVARGLPLNSPLLGEAQEDEAARNTAGQTANLNNNSLLTNPLQPGSRAQYLGNVLDSNNGVISVGGTLEAGVGGGIGFAFDTDFYQFEIRQTDTTQAAQHFPVVIDVDYADGFGRPDTTLAVYYDPDGQTGATAPQLVLFAEDSNIAEDRQAPLDSVLGDEFERGSIGAGDPFIGTTELPEGNYFVGVVPSGFIPAELRDNPDVRREPINSLIRIVDDGIESNGGATAALPLLPSFLPETLEAGWVRTTLQSNVDGHGRLPAFDSSRQVGLGIPGAIQGEREPNDFLTQAHDLDFATPFWSRDFNAEIDIPPDNVNGFTNTSTSLPHTTVVGNLTDLADVYTFEVLSAGEFTADIDGGSTLLGTGASSVDTDLILINNDGNEIFRSDITGGNDFDPMTMTWLDVDFGSVNPSDPFLPNPVDSPLTLEPGRYFLAVVGGGTVWNPGTRTFTNPITDAGGTLETGDYRLHVSLETHPVAPPAVANESLHIPGGVGIQQSNAFDLEGYVAEDLPRFYFNYLVDGQLNVRIISDQNPGGTIVASSNNAGGVDLLPGDWRQAIVELGDFAGHTGIKAEFDYGGGTGAFLDDFIVGFAERGELVTGASTNDPNPQFVGIGNFSTITTGEYQLEIRPSSDVGITTNTSIQLTESFDTNDRLEETVSIIAPAGYQLRDIGPNGEPAMFFEVNDGFTSILFEFDDINGSNPGVTLGRTSVPFSTDMSAAEVAQAIIASINNPAVQSQLNVKAASSGGIDSGDTLGDARINLFGNASGDFNQITPESLEIQSTADITTLAGNGIEIANAFEVGSVGTFTGGQQTIGIAEGIVLSTGELSSISGPNLSSNTSSTSVGFGDTDIDSAFGVTTADHASIEFDFVFSDVTPASSDFFLEYAYASEEFAEGTGIPDIVAVLLSSDGAPFTTVPIDGNLQLDSSLVPASDVTINDPAVGGSMLQEFALDGVTRVGRIQILGLDPTVTHRVRIVVADTVNNVGDSALFLAAGSASIDVPDDANLLPADATGRVQLPSQFHLGNGDTNHHRQQGQLLIHSNTISDVRGYGIWLDNADREQDPEDFRADGSVNGFGEGSPHQFLSQPNLGPSYSGAVRNLRTLNDSEEGGVTPGAVVFNNVIDQAGVGGVQVNGALAPFMIDGNVLGVDPDNAASVGHFGSQIADGTILTIDAGQTRVVFEFEDLTIPPGGNGVAPGNVPIYYRRDVANANNPYNSRLYGSSEHEVMLGIYDAILGSVLVTNDVVSLVDVWVGPSLIEDSITLNDGSRGSLSYVNPTLYIEGATRVEFTGTIHRNAFLFDRILPDGSGIVPQAPIGATAQPFARIVNNTIYGEDGNLASFSESGFRENDDTIDTAIVTGQGRAHSPNQYTTSGFIGDSTLVNPTQDVDFYQVELEVGDRLEAGLLQPDTAPITVAGIVLPNGNASFADSVVAYNNLAGGGPAPIGFDDPEAALGRPELTSASDSFVSLGNGGFVVLEFVDNVLVPSGDATPDLHVFESGTQVEATSVEISEDGINFVSVGQADGATSSIDIDAFPDVDLNGLYRFVRITDSPFDAALPDSFGADIDGVAAISTNVSQFVDGTIELVDQTGQLLVSQVDASSGIDFTATRSGTYYVGVSADGNSGYDPLSLAGRGNGDATGGYRLTLDVHASREFVITAQSNYGNATFTIEDVTGRQVTFGFNGSAPAGGINIPTPNAPTGGIRPWDYAQAIADAINSSPLFNQSNGNGPNGLDGPIQRVTATAVGGIDAVQAGVDRIGVGGLRVHHAGPNVTDFPLGIGHDHIQTTQNGTSELYVVIEGASRIINNGIILDPAGGVNVDQLIPETGISVVQGASPTVLNNVILNTHIGVYNEETRHDGFGGTNADEHPKPNTLIVGGNLFQGIPSEDVVPNNRSLVGDGIVRGPSNVTAGSFDTLDDFNFELTIDQRVLTNPAGGNFIPFPGSFAIDSSLNSVPEREGTAAFLNSLGISPNPVIAPLRDVFGLLRVDDTDPDLQTPPGIGGNPFIDRGAVERADFVGPDATLIVPLDNAPDGSDRDATLTNVDLLSETPREFRIKLEDVANLSDPFVGTGIDSDSVISAFIDGVREEGAVVTLFENGVLLEEGIHYTFRYAESSETIILTPLAGIWRSDAYYQIGINNRDRFVLVAPQATEIADGDQFTVTDTEGGVVTFEYDTGYQLQVPVGLSLNVPVAGGGAGGVQDGDQIRVTTPDGLITTVFELDRDGSFISGNIPIPFLPTDDQFAILNSINQAIVDRSRFPVQSIEDLGSGELALEISSGASITFESSTGNPSPLDITINGTNATIQVLTPGEVFDGDLLRITAAGGQTTTYEVDFDGSITPGNLTLTVLNATNNERIATSIASTIRQRLFPIIAIEDADLSSGSLFLAAEPGTIIDTGFTNITQEAGSLGLRLIDVETGPVGIGDGDTFTVNDGGQTITFEFDDNGAFNAANTPIPVGGIQNTADFADQIAASLGASGLTVQPTVIGNVVHLGLSEGGSVTTTGNSASVVGISRPLQDGNGFTVSKQRQAISITPNTAASLTDGDTFRVSIPGGEVSFELDDNSTLNSITNQAVDITGLTTADDVAQALVTAIENAGLNVAREDVSSGVTYLTFDEGAEITTGGTSIRVSDARTVEFQYATVDSASRDIDINLDGLVDLRIPIDSDNDGNVDVATPRDTNGDGVVDTLYIETNNDTPLDLNGLPLLDAFGFEEVDLTIPFDLDQDLVPDHTVVTIPILITQTAEEIAALTAAAIQNEAVFGLTPVPAGNGLLSVGGTPDVTLSINANTPLSLTGTPGTTPRTTLDIAGPLVLQLPNGGGVGVPDAATFTIDNGGTLVTFEFDLGAGLSDPLNVPVPYQLTDTVVDIANTLSGVIAASGLGIQARTIFGDVLLDGVDESQVTVPISTPISLRRGTVNDGESVTISDGSQSVTFEFQSAAGGGGVTDGNQAVVFSPTGSAADVATSLAAAISNSALQIATEVTREQIVLIGDNPKLTVNAANTNSVVVSGVAGGAVPVPVVRASSFSSESVRDSIINAVNTSGLATPLTARNRGGDTIFLENVSNISPNVTHYFLGAVTDGVGNPLKSNQQDDSVLFTILLSGNEFDYGDAPDPVDNVPGRYPTSRANDGARHLLTFAVDVNGNRELVGPRLGSLIDADPDGQPQRDADGDDDSLVVDAQNPAIFDVTDTDVGPQIRVNPSTGPLPAIYEGSLLTVSNGLEEVIFEIDSDGMFDEDHIRIAFNPNPTDGSDPTDAEALIANLADAIRQSGLQLADFTRSGSTLTLVADDEDGFTIGSPSNPTVVLRQNAPTDVTFSFTGVGILDGWIDFNRDGDWLDPGERVFNGVAFDETNSLFTTQITIPATTPVLDTIEGVTTLARFRVSTAGSAAPTGLALDGEVEDYAIRIVAGEATANDDNNALFTVGEDAVLTRGAGQGVLSNDVSRQGSSLSVFSDDVGNFRLDNGNLTLNADGSFEFTPDPDFVGINTFTYRAVDQGLLDSTGSLLVTDPATVTITVVPENDPPTGAVLEQRVATSEDTPLLRSIEQYLTNFTPTVTDDFTPGPANEQDQTLSVELTNGGVTDQQGTVRIQGDNLIYTPAPDFSGEDTFIYRVVDNGTPPQSVNVLVRVNVGEANDPPVPVNQSYTTNEDVTLQVQAVGGLLTGAFDPDGSAAALQVLSVNTANTVGSVTFGSDGSFVYTPAPNFAGTDTFTYTIVDADFGPSSADVTIDVAQIPDPPRASGVPLVIAPLQEDAGSGFVNLDDSFTDADLPFGDFLTYNVISVAPLGIVTTDLNGPLLEVSPVSNQSGTAFIVIRADDTQSSTGFFEQTLTVTVNPSNDPPVVIGNINDQIVAEDSQIAPISLSGIFADPDNEPLTITVVTNTNPGLVGASIVNGQLLIDLAANESGNATIVLQATDAAGFAVTEQFDVIVLAQADNPTAGTDSYTALAGGTLQVLDPSVGLLANDGDVDGDTVTILSFSQPGLGSVTVDTLTGGFTYTNDSGSTGDVDSFTYILQDSTGRQSTGTVNITIGDPLLTHHNPAEGMDVSADGNISPIDALLIINLLNRSGGGSVPVRNLDPAPFYYDTSADAQVTAIDALLVLNELNRRSSTGVFGEGELSVPVDMLSSSVIAGRGAVNQPQLVNPELTEEKETPDVSVGQIFSDLQDDHIDNLLTAISSDQEEEEESDFSESIDVAIDQMLGEFN